MTLLRLSLATKLTLYLSFVRATIHSRSLFPKVSLLPPMSIPSLVVSRIKSSQVSVSKARSTHFDSFISAYPTDIEWQIACRGILKGSSKPSILLASTLIILHKADILPGFPAYAPILPLPLPPKLPWASEIPGEPTIGETRESRLSIRRGFGAGGGNEGGEVWIKATRKGSAFGPGDSVPVFVQLGWGGDVPIRVSSLLVMLSRSRY